MLRRTAWLGIAVVLAAAACSDGSTADTTRAASEPAAATMTPSSAPSPPEAAVTTTVALAASTTTIPLPDTTEVPASLAELNAALAAIASAPPGPETEEAASNLYKTLSAAGQVPFVERGNVVSFLYWDGSEIRVEYKLGHGLRHVYEVYLPPGHEELTDLPVLYVTDGSDFSNWEIGGMPVVLDNLIGAGAIRPVMAAFIDASSQDRTENRREAEFLERSEDYSRFVATELMPVIDAGIWRCTRRRSGPWTPTTTRIRCGRRRPSGWASCSMRRPTAPATSALWPARVCS